MSQGLLCGSFSSILDHQPPPPRVPWISHGLPCMKQRTRPCTKHMLELLRTTPGSGFCLPNSDLMPHVATWLRANGGCFWAHWSWEATEESSNLGPNPRNDLAIWSDICCAVTLGFHKHTLKHTDNQKTQYSKSFSSHWQTRKKQLELFLKYPHVSLGLTIHGELLLLCWLIASW